MSWIRLREDLHDNPAVVTIASRVTVTPCHVVGALARVWAWAGRLAEDGVVKHATPGMIDTITHTSGLAAAMEVVGWLVVGESYLKFPKWDRHNGENARKRALVAERQRRCRAKAVTHVTRDAKRDVTPKRRGEEKREEKKKNPPNPPVPGGLFVEPPPKPPRVLWTGHLPDGLRRPDVELAWQDWLEHRSHGGKGGAVSQRSGDAALKQLESWGPDEAVRAIRHAIASNYQGLFPAPRVNGSTPNGKGGVQTLEDRNQKARDRLVEWASE